MLTEMGFRAKCETLWNRLDSHDRARWVSPTPRDGRQWRGPNRLTMIARPQPQPRPRQHLKPAGLPGMLDVSAAILHGGTGAEAIQSGNGRERALLRPSEEDDIGAL